MSYNFRPENKSLVDVTVADIRPGISDCDQQKAEPLTPLTKKSYRLEDLLKRCTLKQLHGETDLGADVGREVIE